MRLPILCVLALALPGCVSTAASIVTLPVKAAGTAVGAVGKGVDLATTSQSEADEKRGRAIRKYEECVGKEQRRAQAERRVPNYSRCQQ